ncbi:hypothetical protein [Alkaliphilus transvaalensis]|uniref:hypothetical protein n=1 Tax=Alkaliphilus transvaalensis TaxID=114628 RepID=UPI00047E084F|nr:hypothetical protein [Alkaliphilus transvaalensis]
MKKLYKGVAVIVILMVIIVPLLGEGAVSQPSLPNNVPNNPIEVSSREEVIYGTLQADGGVKEIYVVNILELPQAGVVTDYGNFVALKNLTNTQELISKNGEVSVGAEEGLFYYQGTLKEKELPWNIELKYFLNGEDTPPADLAGKAGNLEIILNTSQNTKIDSRFYENYLLQVSLNLDASTSSNIIAEGGTIANAGSNRMITYTILPGNEGKVRITADVTDFSMEGIEISAVPFTMMMDNFDTGEMTGQMLELSEAIILLNDGVAKLEKGTAEFKEGTITLEIGSSDFNEGLSDLDHSSKDLIEGSKEIKEALNMIDSSLQQPSEEVDLTSLVELSDGLSELALALTAVTDGLTELREGFSQAHLALKSAILEIPDSEISQEELTALYMANADQKKLIDQLVAFYKAGKTVQGTYEAVNPAFKAMEEGLEEIIASNKKIEGVLTEMSLQMKGATEAEGQTQMLELFTGLSILAANYNEFHVGLVAYTGGVNQLAYGYGSLDEGISDISSGALDIHQGIKELYGGTEALSDGVKDLPQQIESEIDKAMGQYDKSDFKAVSFVSDKNSGTTAVQFVMKSESIEKPIVIEAQEVESVNENIWTRFLKLFKR